MAEVKLAHHFRCRMLNPSATAGSPPNLSYADAKQAFNIAENELYHFFHSVSSPKEYTST